MPVNYDLDTLPERVLVELANQPESPVELLAALGRIAEHRSVRLARKVRDALNADTATKIAMTRLMFAGGEDDSELAEDELCPPELLVALYERTEAAVGEDGVEDLDTFTVALLCENPATPRRLLDVLYEIDNVELRASLARNPSTDPAKVAECAAAPNPRIFRGALSNVSCPTATVYAQLDNPTESETRLAAIAESSAAPPDAIHTAVTRSDRARGPALRNPVTLTETLDWMWANTPTHSERDRIVEHPNVSVEILADVVRTAGNDAITHAAAESAHMTEALLDELALHGIEALGTRILVHPNVSAVTLAWYAESPGLNIVSSSPPRTMCRARFSTCSLMTRRSTFGPSRSATLGGTRRR